MPSAGKRLDHAAVLARDRFDAGHEFLVLALRVVDQRNRRRRHRRQRAISPGWFMPSSSTAARCASSRSRSSVSGTPMSLLKLPAVASARVAVPGAQDRRDHLRHRGLAVAAGDRDQRQVKRRRQAPASSPSACAAVGDLQPGQAGRVEAALGQRRHRTGRLRLRQEVVGVEALAAQRDEQVARLQAAGVAVHAPIGSDAVADQRRCRAAARAAWASVIIGAAPLGRGAQPRQLRGLVDVGERLPHAADLLVVLVALAGDQHDVGRRRAPRTAWRDRGARGPR